MKNFIPFILCLILNSCLSQTSVDYVLTNEEKIICIDNGLDTTIVKEIRKTVKSKIESFHYSKYKIHSDSGTKEVSPIRLDGIVFKTENHKSYDLIFSLKKEFNKLGYTIFMLECNFGFDGQKDVIAVLKTVNKLEILKSLETDGINYDIDSDSLLNIISDLDKKYELDLIGASGDYCEFIITKEPKKWLDFAKEIYKFCPDIVDQGTETVEKLAEEMKISKTLYLWWD
ncbi:MAG: DUF4253 domain-containing protein [Flavobacteriales bacterium]